MRKKRPILLQSLKSKEGMEFTTQIKYIVCRTNSLYLGQGLSYYMHTSA